MRYEVVDTIAQGDFATVYRGRDAQLDREVAIKQIHEQYRHDERQLERYWREAQTLAALEHPNIVAIYDVVRDQGWLILELMRASVKQMLEVGPMKPADVRQVLLGAATALGQIHSSGIIHGDVKPGNLFVSKTQTIKLGDFGLARRVDGDEGSVVKGTTKYMAPEVLSDQFGPVGPPSDIYSLGFTAIELLCGPKFGDLFPGLSMFGRDERVAWMMWHSAADRRLPDLREVIPGIPEPLAAVLQKMTHKNPRHRYDSTTTLIQDLSEERMPAAEDHELERQRQANERRQAKRKRALSIGALAMSVILSMTLLFWPSEKEPPPPPPRLEEGIVLSVVEMDRAIFLDQGKLILDKRDKILLNGSTDQIASIQPGDHIAIQYLEDGSKLVDATRPPLETITGTLQSIKSAAFSIKTANGEELEVRIASAAALSLNGHDAFYDQLQEGDLLEVTYRTYDDGPLAEGLVVTRTMTFDQGVVHSYDVGRKRLRFTSGEQPFEVTVDDSKCQIELNGQTMLDGRTFTAADLRAGDRLTLLSHDQFLRRVVADRFVVTEEIVQSVSQNEILTRNGRFRLTPDTSIAFQGRPIAVGALRAEDRIEVTHYSLGNDQIDATQIRVRALVPDSTRVAIVIGPPETYQDVQITRLPGGRLDATAIRDGLAGVYRALPERLLIVPEVDGSRAAVVGAVERFLEAQGKLNEQQQVAGARQLVVYCAGQVFVEPIGSAYLACQDTQLDKIGATGLSLRWLIDVMERYPAHERVLLLDTCHPVSVREAEVQPSPPEQLDKIRQHGIISPSVAVITSCGLNERGGREADSDRGWFAAAVGRALDGFANPNLDDRVGVTELTAFLDQELSGKGQTPQLFKPDPRTFVLDEGARQAVSELLKNVDNDQLKAAGPARDALLGQFQAAQNLVGEEHPDAQLAYALVELSIGQTGASLREFQEVVRRHPTLVAPHALTYQMAARGNAELAAGYLTTVIERLSQCQDEAYADHVATFAGQLSGFYEFALRNASVTRDVAEAVGTAALSDRLKAAYEKGRTLSRRLAEDNETRLSRFCGFDAEPARRHLELELNRTTR